MVHDANPPAAVYDPVAGFNMGFDFASGLLPDAAKLQAVYGIFANGVPVMDQQYMRPISTRIDPVDTRASCVMSFNKLIKDVPAMSDAQLIIELQGIGRTGPPFIAGWAFLNLFDAANKLK